MSIFRLGDQRPPEPQRINDDVVMRFEHVYEVDPEKMRVFPPAGDAGLGHTADRRGALGPPGLDARPLRGRGPVDGPWVRDDARGDE